MIIMITIILSVLVAINFLLLKFSCNKTHENEVYEKPFVIKNSKPTITTESSVSHLAPTGS